MRARRCRPLQISLSTKAEKVRRQAMTSQGDFRYDAERTIRRLQSSRGVSLLAVSTSEVTDGKDKDDAKDVPVFASPAANTIKPEGPRRLGMRQTTFDAAYLASAFCALFLSYSVCQNFLTTLFPSSGFLSLAFIYASFGISSLFAPTIGRLKPISGDIRLAIFVGGCLYVNMMISIGSGYLPYLLVSSTLTGLGAAMVWIHQGVYLEAAARKRTASDIVCQSVPELPEEADKRLKKAIGRIAGVFWPIQSTSGVIGNCVGLAVLASGATSTIMIWTFCGIGGVALVMLFFANSEYREYRPLAVQFSEKQLAVVGKTGAHGAWKDFKELLSFMFSKLALLMIPLFTMQGMTGAWTTGILPSLISAEDGGAKALTIYFLIHAIACTIASNIASRLYEIRWGWAWVALFCGCGLAGELALSGFMVTGHMGSPGDTLRKVSLALTAVSAGTFDSAYNALISCTLMKISRSGPRPLVLFAAYRFFSCLAGFVPMSIAATLSKPHPGDPGLARWWMLVEAGIAGWFAVFCGTFTLLNVWAIGGSGKVSAAKPA